MILKKLRAEYQVRVPRAKSVVVGLVLLLSWKVRALRRDNFSIVKKHWGTHHYKTWSPNGNMEELFNMLALFSSTQ